MNSAPSLIDGELGGFKTSPWLLLAVGRKGMNVTGSVRRAVDPVKSQEISRVPTFFYYICVCVHVCLYCWHRGRWRKSILSIHRFDRDLGGFSINLNCSPYLYFLHFRSDICLLKFTVWSGSLNTVHGFFVFSRQRKKVILKHSKMNLKLSSQESDFILNHQVFNL